MHTSPRSSFIAGLLLVLVLVSITGLYAPAASSAMSPERAWSSRGPAVAWAADNAMHLFSRTPCGGRYAVRWKSMSGTILGNARWHYVRGRSRAWRSYTKCIITLNRDHAGWTWPRVCTVIVHEMGHLVGHPHAPRPGRLMSARYTNAIGTCTRPLPRRMPRTTRPLPTTVPWALAPR